MDLAASVAKTASNVLLVTGHGAHKEQARTAKQSITTRLHLERLVMEERVVPKENQVHSK